MLLLLLMSDLLGLTPGTAKIYLPFGQYESAGIAAASYVEEYERWHLVLQPEKDRQKRGVAAGLIIAKRAVVLVTDLEPAEWADLKNVLETAPRKLCEKVGVTFTGHFIGPAFNNGSFAGQTQAQVHAHLYPVITEEFPGPGVRNGMGAMIEAHRQYNLGH